MRIRLSLACIAAISTLAVAPAVANAETKTFTNATGFDFSNDLGQANPYPATLPVDVQGRITKVVARLDGLSKADAGDIEILLASPGNIRGVPLMADAGGTAAITNATLTFDDAAADGLPPGTATISTGTYKPSNYDNTLIFNPPAPPPPFPTTLAAGFNDTFAVGTWSLYGFDDFFTGSASGDLDGFALTITTALPKLTAKAPKTQKLKKKVKLIVSSDVAGQLALTGPVKKKTVTLAKDAKTTVKAKLKTGVAKKLAAKIADRGKTTVTVNLALTDDSGAVGTSKVKAKLVG